MKPASPHGCVTRGLGAADAGRATLPLFSPPVTYSFRIFYPKAVPREYFLKTKRQIASTPIFHYARAGPFHRLYVSDVRDNRAGQCPAAAPRHGHQQTFASARIIFPATSQRVKRTLVTYKRSASP